MGSLRFHVHVVDDAGVGHWFGPGDEVPEWASSQIVNEGAWAEDSESDDEATPKRRTRKAN